MADVLFEKRPDGVGLITLNRPESLNALNFEIFDILREVIAECEADRAVRCVALTGAGRAFCAGGDVKAMASGQGPLDPPAGSQMELGAALDHAVGRLRAWHEATSLKLHSMPKPTVALVNGVAVGAGLSLALACDLRFCSEQARFGTAFRNVGLSGDFGGSYFLQRLIGAGRARELYFTGEIIDAQRALDLGIANRVVAHELLMPDGLAFCATLASGPTAAFARMKDNLNFAETSSLQALLAHEALNQRLSNLSRDHKEAALAFVEKRQPEFRGE
jgi:2-(1,2-epoxy-1,2-dihydrophenyl)acetyl-CoA isomerase